MKTGDLTLVYGAVAVISAVLLVGYLLLEKKRERNFLMLTACVAVANCGYFLLAAAGSLPMAMVANGIAYFGAAYSVLAMLLIIWDVCQMKQRPWLFVLSIAISTAAFLLAASGDWLGLYYRSVELVEVNGMSCLIKEYGPLHLLYTVYLLVYVVAMTIIVLYAAAKKRLASPKYTGLLLVAVLLNVGVWAVEQAVNIDFEFLCVSYIVTEMILLLLHGILRDYGLVNPGGSLVTVQMLTQVNARRGEGGQLPAGMEDMFRSFAEKVKTLTSAERRMLNYYIAGYEIQDIPDLAYISIHTVKKHNRSIYQKLEIASRDELMLYIELFRSCGRLQELTGEEAAQK
jgi:DNA-binding CsgD family transcriptional regulator